MHMSRYTLFKSALTGIIFLLVSGCSKLTQFYLNYSQNITISPGLGIGIPFTTSTPPFPTESTVAFENNNTQANLVESCKLKEIQAEITQPTNYDFSFLNQIDVFLSATSLPEIKIAYSYNISENIGKKLTLETTDVELKEYIKKDQLSIRISTVQDKVTLEEVKAKLDCKFFIDAKILGF